MFLLRQFIFECQTRTHSWALKGGDVPITFGSNLALQTQVRQRCSSAPNPLSPYFAKSEGQGLGNGLQVSASPGPQLQAHLTDYHWLLTNSGLLSVSQDMPSFFTVGSLYWVLLQPDSLSLQVATWLIPSPSLRLLSKCYILKEVSPDHHHFNCKPRHPLSQPPGTLDPLYSTQLILPRAPVLLAECMMDWLVMFISCLSPPTECMLLAAGSFLTHITRSLAHGRDFINCCWIDEPAWALESNKPGFKSPLTWYSMTLL